MSNINYSIIIPHYNVPELLLRCLRSIPCRKDVEIIIADDCSEDFYICEKQIGEEFAEKNIRICSTDRNSGPGAARNIGLKHASGKWIIFEDADDFFGNDLNRILDLCLNRTEDVLVLHNRAVMSDDVNKKADDYVYEELLARYERTHNDEELRYHHYSVWGKIYSRQFLRENNICFENVLRGQDLLFSVRVGVHCTDIAVLPYLMNIVTCRSGSLSRSWQDWSEWYSQYFPVHVKAMHYLHGCGIKATDRSVYDKLFFIMRHNCHTFKKMFLLLNPGERIRYFPFMFKKLIGVCVKKLRVKSE